MGMAAVTVVTVMPVPLVGIAAMSMAMAYQGRHRNAGNGRDDGVLHGHRRHDRDANAGGMLHSVSNGCVSNGCDGGDVPRGRRHCMAMMPALLARFVVGPMAVMVPAFLTCFAMLGVGVMMFFVGVTVMTMMPTFMMHIILVAMKRPMAGVLIRAGTVRGTDRRPAV